MRISTLKITRGRGRWRRALTAAAATITLAGGALATSAGGAQADSWQATYPTPAQLSSPLPNWGAVDNTASPEAVCTTGDSMTFYNEFMADAESPTELAGNNYQLWEPISAPSNLFFDSRWVDTATSTYTVSGDEWWYPLTAYQTDPSGTFDNFPAGVSQVTCGEVVPEPDGQGDGNDVWDIVQPSGSPTLFSYEGNVASLNSLVTTTYEVEPNGPPTVSFDASSPASNSWVQGPTAVTVDTGNLSTGDSPTVLCSTPSGVFDATTTADGSVTIPASYGTSSGTNTYTCQAINGLGQTSSSVTLSFNVDSSPVTGGYSGTNTPGGGESVSTTPPSGPWDVGNVNYTGTDDYTVTVGSSGLASVQCVDTDTDTTDYPGSGAADPDAGQSTTYGLTGAHALAPPSGVTNTSLSAGGTYLFSVPLYQGQNSLVCNATNGASASSPTYTANPLVDSVMPSVAFTGGSGTGGSGTVTVGSTLWLNSPNATINLTALAGASGLATPLTGAESGQGPAEDPDDDSIACTPSNENVAIGGPTSTSLLSSSDLTSGQTADGFVIGVQNTYEPTGSGLTTLGCVSMNGAGVYQDSPLEQQVGIDTTTPSVTLSDTGSVSLSSDDWSNAWQPSTSGVTIDASTSGASGIGGVACTVNGSPVTVTGVAGNPASGPGDYEYTIAGNAFTNGANAISCVASSVDQLVSPAESKTLNLDTTAPTIQAANLPASGWQTSQSVSFNGTAGPSGIASVVCTVDGGAPSTYTPAPGTTSWSVGVPLGGNGSHSVDCRLTNGAGVTIDSGPVTVGVDNEAPGITWTGVPASQWVSSSVPVVVTGSAGASGVASVTCQLDGGSWSTTQGASASIAVTGSGSHSLACYDKSNSGLTSSIQTQDVQVDTITPAESFSGAAPGTWLTNSSNQSVTINSTAGLSGVQAIDCTVDGTAQAPVNPSNEQFNSSTGIYSTSAAFAITGNGRHTIACRTVAGSGAATATQTEEIDIDSSTPGITLTDEGQALSTGWLAGTQTVVATANIGPSGVSQTANNGQGGLVCAVDGGAPQITGAASEQLTISGNGQHSIACSIEDAAGLTYTLPTESLDIDSTTPEVTLSGATFDVWQQQDQSVTVSAAAGQSGLATPTCAVDGNQQTLTPVSAGDEPAVSDGYAYAAAWTFKVAGSGNHAVQCTEQDGAGQADSTEVQHVEISQPAGTSASGSAGELTAYGSTPSIDGGADPFSSGPSQTAWATSAQSVVVTANPGENAAPISDIKCAGAPGLQGGGNYPMTAANATSQGGEKVTVDVGDPGGDLSCTAVDQAGVTYQLGSYDFLIDAHAPTGQILPQAQWPAPNTVAATLSDGVAGSGVKGASLEITGHGVDDSLPMTYDPSSGNWVGTIDDGAIKAGAYTLTVGGTDNAGNSGTIAAETIELPLRAETRLSVAATTKGAAQTRKQLTAKTAAACKRTRSSHEATIARACSSAAPSSIVRLRDGLLATPFGRKVSVSGRLTDTASKQPLADTPLTVSATPIDGGKTSTLATISTNGRGDYSYILHAGESRTVTVSYAGSTTALGATASFKQVVPGKVTISATAHLHAGRDATLSGRVLGGYIPTTGVQVRVEYEIPGHTRWALFQATHTTEDGRFAVRFPIAAGAGGYRYDLRVVVPAQSDWPFQSATSNTLVRQVGN